MRPSKFSAELGHAIAIHVGYGCSLEQAAQAEGIAPDTLRRWLRRYPAFAAEVDQARAQCVVKLLRHVNRAAEKDWKAAAWFLERLHSEHTDPAASSGPGRGDERPRLQPDVRRGPGGVRGQTRRPGSLGPERPCGDR